MDQFGVVVVELQDLVEQVVAEQVVIILELQHQAQLILVVAAEVEIILLLQDLEDQELL